MVAVCVSAAVHVVVAIIYWPTLVSRLPPFTIPTVAKTEPSEIPAGPRVAVPSADTNAVAVVSQTNSRSQPLEVKVSDAAFLRPGESVAGVYPDGLLIETVKGSAGIGLRKVSFEKLPESVRRRYGYDPQRAAEYAADQARWIANYRAESQRAASADTSDEERERVEVLAALVSEYHKTHTYSMEDKFVCADMACDVWNMVRTKGFPARIQIGNISRDITSLAEANHAWVLADVSQGKWLALETTAGRVVLLQENPRYYRGWSFESPKKYKEFCYQHSYVP